MTICQLWVYAPSDNLHYGGTAIGNIWISTLVLRATWKLHRHKASTFLSTSVISENQTLYSYHSYFSLMHQKFCKKKKHKAIKCWFLYNVNVSKKFDWLNICCRNFIRSKSLNNLIPNWDQSVVSSCLFAVLKFDQ